MNIPFVDLKTQYQNLKHEIDSAIAEVIEETAFIGGRHVAQFCEDFAAYIGTPFCVPCGNGTDAIQIALKALGVGTGDEVIVPAMTFIATSEAVTACGANPVFVDVHPEYYTLDPSLVEQAITKKTKAIIPVHLYGQPADMAVIMEIARRHNLIIVEDAAQAHGARFARQRVGTFGHAVTFSFYPGKNLGAYGDGGAILTADRQLAQQMKMWANHGRIDKYNHRFEGYNSRLDGLQAAILQVKLNFLEEWNHKRRAVAARYSELLRNVGDLTVPRVHPDAEPVWHLYVVQTDFRDALIKYLKEQGIGVGIHYPIALPFLEAYKEKGYSPEEFPVASTMQNRILSLPIFPEMTEQQQAFVVEKIKEFFK